MKLVSKRCIHTLQHYNKANEVCKHSGVGKDACDWLGPPASDD